jgi:hypothetical protein
METKLHGAFELTCAEVKVPAGEIIYSPPYENNILYVGSNFDYITLQSNGGKVILKNIETGEELVRFIGDTTNLDTPLNKGEYQVIFEDEFDYFCFAPSLNVDYLPLREKLTYFKLLSGQSTEVEQGKKLFLAFGSLDIGGKTYSGTNRIKFSSGNKTVTALEDSYGFFINI